MIPIVEGVNIVSFQSSGIQGDTMITYATMEEFEAAVASTPKPKTLLTDTLYLKGAMCQKGWNHMVGNGPTPKIVFDRAAEIEEIVKRCYAPLEVFGIQVEGYHGMITAVSDGEAVAEIQLFTPFVQEIHTKTFLFEAYLPIGDYERNTRVMLADLRPMIQGIGSASPIIPEGADPRKYAPGEIVFMRDESIVATGKRAIEELGMCFVKPPEQLVACSYRL